ncbi:MAG: hypothetical protein ABI789_02665 [Usitatibacter sp.]
MSATGRVRLSGADILLRTAEGTRRMSTRDTDLSSKLRSVLFLITGRATVAELLDGAGNMRDILEGQVATLIEMDLVEAVSTSPPPPELPPVAGAKIELLKRLEASGSCEAALLADELLDARTLRELAVRAREIAYRLRDVDGNAIAEKFWAEAKKILVAWRDLAMSSGR